MQTHIQFSFTQLKQTHRHIALLLCSICFHLSTLMLSLFPSPLGIIFCFLSTRFSVPLLLSWLPSLHIVSELSCVSHDVSIIHAHKRSVFLCLWTQTVDHALIYFSSLLFLPLCFSLSCLTMTFFCPYPPLVMSPLLNLPHIPPPCPPPPLTHLYTHAYICPLLFLLCFTTPRPVPFYFIPNVHYHCAHQILTPFIHLLLQIQPLPLPPTCTETLPYTPSKLSTPPLLTTN